MISNGGLVVNGFQLFGSPPETLLDLAVQDRMTTSFLQTTECQRM